MDVKGTMVFSSFLSAMTLTLIFFFFFPLDLLYVSSRQDWIEL